MPVITPHIHSYEGEHATVRGRYEFEVVNIEGKSQVYAISAILEPVVQESKYFSREYMVVANVDGANIRRAMNKEKFDLIRKTLFAYRISPLQAAISPIADTRCHVAHFCQDNFQPLQDRVASHGVACQVVSDPVWAMRDG